jgi:hypothetical protein
MIVLKALPPASFAYYLLICAGLAAGPRPKVLLTGIMVMMGLNLIGISRYHVTQIAAEVGFRED